MVITLVILLIALAVYWFIEHLLVREAQAENAALKRELDAAKIHRDEHGRFVHERGRTPMSDYEDL